MLLNRAPTLHRLGIQAFEPVLVEGKAIHLHPLVCTPYNADFDGDQMAVHLPLSAGAQAEARILMLSSNNILQPSFGNPVSIPTQDMVLGLYYLTFNRDEYEGPAQGAAIADEQFYAHRTRVAQGIALRRQTIPRNDSDVQRSEEARHGVRARHDQPARVDHVRCDGERIRTTVGRAILNLAFRRAGTIRSSTTSSTRARSRRLITDCYRKYGNAETAEFLDAIKALGFHYATQSGTTVSISDIVVPQSKYDLLDKAQSEVDELHRLFDQGFISDDERYNKTIEVWSKASDDVTQRHAGRAEPAQPGVHDGDLGRSWFDRAGQAARRYARTHVRPVGPNPGDSGQGFAQRRPHRSRVLHLDARRA